MAKRQNKLKREKRFTPHWVVDDLFAVSDKVFCHCFLQSIDRNCHITTCELTGSTNQHICSYDCKLGSDLLMTDSFQSIGMGTGEQRPTQTKRKQERFYDAHRWAQQPYFRESEKKKNHRRLSRKEVHMMKTMMCLGGRQEKREKVCKKCMETTEAKR
jgi:hypothetical protein